MPLVANLSLVESRFLWTEADLSRTKQALFHKGRYVPVLLFVVRCRFVSLRLSVGWGLKVEKLLNEEWVIRAGVEYLAVRRALALCCAAIRDDDNGDHCSLRRRPVPASPKHTYSTRTNNHTKDNDPRRLK